MFLRNIGYTSMQTHEWLYLIAQVGDLFKVLIFQVISKLTL